MKKYSVLIILLCSVTQAQHRNFYDRNFYNIKRTSDTIKVQQLLSLSDQYTTSDISRAILFSNEALRRSKDIGYQKGIVNALSQLSDSYSRINDERKALDLLFQLLQLDRKAKNSFRVASTLLSIGNSYSRLGAYPNALEYFFKSLRLFESIGNKEKTAIVLWNIGKAYENQKDSIALDYYLESAKQLELEKSKTDKILKNDVMVNSFGNNPYT